MGASLEGKFWLSFILISALTTILAIFTENEQILFKESEFAAESTLKGIEFLAEKVNQKCPSLRKWMPKAGTLKRLFAFTKKDATSKDETEDFETLFDLLTQERVKVQSFWDAVDWEVSTAEVPFTLSTPMLPGVYEYADMMKSSGLSDKTRESFKNAARGIDAAKAYKNIITAWFDKKLLQQKLAFLKSMGQVLDLIHYLKSALRHGNILDERLRNAVKRKLRSLEGVLFTWNDKFISAYKESFEKLKALYPATDEDLKPEKAVDTDKYYHFTEFRRIFEEIEDLEFK